MMTALGYIVSIRISDAFSWANNRIEEQMLAVLSLFVESLLPTL